MQSVYRRPLPEPLVPFASPEGRALFREALEAGTMERYFALAEQFHTQADPAFCGLASLVVALNALAIDPGRLWKGPWRWFSEELLDCCIPLAQVQKAGLTLDELACLARCNGASAVVHRTAAGGEAAFRELIETSCRAVAGPILVAAYSRSALGQTGSGHFSPLAGYHRERDLVLVLDVARFKYPPHWAPVPALFRAMQDADPVTGKSRGVIALERAPAPRNLAFVFTTQDGGFQRITRFLSGGAHAALRRAQPASAPAALRVLLEEAQDAASGIALREMADPQHRQLVEQVLAELRATALHEAVRAVPAGPIAEFGTTVLYLLPADAWSAVGADLAEELSRLCDLTQLTEPLRGDLRALRAQLDALLACHVAPP